MNERHKAHLALLGANLFYGAGFTVAKSVMPTLIKPGGFILIRVLCATFLFWLSFLGGKNYRTKIDRSDFVRLVFCGLLGVATNQLFFFKGLSLTTPIHASLMMLSTPILVSVFAAVVLKEKFSKLNIFGLSLGVLGAAMLVTIAAKDKVAIHPILGDTFVFLNATSYAIYMIIVKPLMHKYRPIIVVRWVFLIGSLFVFPFGIQDFLAIHWATFTPNNYLAVGFIVIGVTFFTYLWNIYAIRILSPAIAGAYIYIQPLFAAIIAILFLGEEMSMIKAAAAILIFVGVFLVSKKTPKS
jgi:drug/metabolite transporter (DMT)-like permease